MDDSQGLAQEASSEPSAPSVSFPRMEEQILSRWKERDLFKKTYQPQKPRYSFYDGPPFATGLPHYGHLLASTLKDIVPRYWTMKGFHIERRWGWDCHGLPIEQEIDKKFHFKSTEDIEAFGVAKYNQECRDIVTRHVDDWRKVIDRLGRWVDFDNDYKTMDLNFMESVWWVIGELWKKGLIYRGYKVMPFSTALGTPLSNFEASSNYQDVQDPAITVTFPLKKDPSRVLLAWTTTPWTLPSNLALMVHDDIDYVDLRSDNGTIYVLAKDLVSSVFKKESVEILKTYKGKDLVGLAYEPLFSYYAHLGEPQFTILPSAHVTAESGTGIVHSAPAHGEDDYIACLKAGIKATSAVDAHGRFVSPIEDYKGLYVKEADKIIIADLKKKGRLFKQDTLQHAYPFCPRTDTPLINRMVGSWFVKVETIKERLIANNRNHTHWVPEHLREGRFGRWLEGARDWAISRNRYWGNPLPIFESFEDPEDSRDYLCFASVNELSAITGRQFTDIHREFLDDITFEKNGKRYRRVPEVLDCWFESGSMPYAQVHYPFENKSVFEASFPAEFIGEGLDQTRGWFYTLSVLGTILFDRPPFKNVIVNGLILASDGKKMSKRLKNYPDPMDVMHSHGADALRLYLINSPVIRGEELRFSEAGVRDIVRRVILKWWNAFTFYKSYADIDGFKPASDLSNLQTLSDNILDQWILSRLQTLLTNIEKEMASYHLYNVVPELLLFIEELTNTYIRLNRHRFWSEGANADKDAAFSTLHLVLISLSKAMAPFTPFLSDYLYLELTQNKALESVHLEPYPVATPEMVRPALERGVALMEEVIELSRNLRDQIKTKVKVPLKELVIAHRDLNLLSDLKPVESYLKSELNIRHITYRNDETAFVTLQAKPNGPVLGPKAGAKMLALTKRIAALTYEEIRLLESGQTLELEGVTIDSGDIRFVRLNVPGPYPVISSQKVIVAIDPSIDRDQELEGLAREVVNRIQKHRKDSNLKLDDRIRLTLATKGPHQSDLAEAIHAFKSYISEQTLAAELQLSGLFDGTSYPIEDSDLIVSVEPLPR